MYSATRLVTRFPFQSAGRTRRVAFTLIEVVISLGICTFVLVSMLGLLTLGLTTLRKSIDFNTEGAITQQLSGEAEIQDYSAVTNTTSPYRLNFVNNRYFDENGVELPNMPAPSSYVYEASLAVNNCVLPGMTAENPVPMDAAEELVFKISTRGPGPPNYFYLWVSNNGR